MKAGAEPLSPSFLILLAVALVIAPLTFLFGFNICTKQHDLSAFFSIALLTGVFIAFILKRNWTFLTEFRSHSGHLSCSAALELLLLLSDSEQISLITGLKNNPDILSSTKDWKSKTVKSINSNVNITDMFDIHPMKWRNSTSTL